MNNEKQNARGASKPHLRLVKSDTSQTEHQKTDYYKLLDDDLTVFRYPRGGNYWQFEFWIKEERKMFRRSTKTRNLEDAITIAKECYFHVRHDIKFGNKIFSKTTQELVSDFLKHKIAEANAGIIVKARVSTIKTTLTKWYLPYIGEKKSLSDLTRNDFQDYWVWLKQHAPDTKNVTLDNYSSMISSLYKWGLNNGYLKHEQVPNIPKRKKGTIERRDDFNREEWAQLYKSFNRYVNKGQDEEDRYNRKIFTDFVSIAVNTGLRFGEMMKLRWQMIKVYESKKAWKNGDRLLEVIIRVPEDTKTGAREVIGQRGDIFNRIKRYSKFTKSDDYVFSAFFSRGQMSEKILRKHWHGIMKESGLDKSNKNLSFYSLRHTYITFRLIQKTDVFQLAKNAGTSVKHIETHYEHLSLEDRKYEVTKNWELEESGTILLYT